MAESNMAAENESYVVPVQSSVTDEERQRYLNLYRAALKGNWDIAEGILRTNTNDIRAKISKVEDTVLHVAARASHEYFIKKLVERMEVTPEDLQKKNGDQNTAFCLAVMSGNMEIVKLMMSRDSELVKIKGENDMLPLQIAALFGHEKIVDHLYEATEDSLENQNLIDLLVTLIDNHLYDAALKLLKKHKELATSRATGNGETALHALARNSLNFSSWVNPTQNRILKSFFKCTNVVQKRRMHPKALELVQLLWEKITSFPDLQISILIGAPWWLIFLAAEQGNHELLCILIDGYPDLIHRKNENGHTILHIAVLNRNERIFKLIFQRGLINDMIVLRQDKEKNNILHLAAKLPPKHHLNAVSGAALQMQRELLWFQGVSKLVPPYNIGVENLNRKTASTLFTESHKDLMKEGEEWMKTTANSCMIVATLIATIVFAAAFTVPGGVKEGTGTPNFLKNVAFTIFAVSDTVSLVLSSCSILTFLSILTARYAEQDFLWSLPAKLLLGLFTLFISVLGMMVVFCTTLFIVFHEGKIWPPPLAVVLAFFPVIMFLLQHTRLFLDVVRLMSSSNSLFQENRRNFLLFKGKQLKEEL